MIMLTRSSERIYNQSRYNGKYNKYVQLTRGTRQEEFLPPGVPPSKRLETLDIMDDQSASLGIMDDDPPEALDPLKPLGA